MNKFAEEMTTVFQEYVLENRLRLVMEIGDSVMVEKLKHLEFISGEAKLSFEGLMDDSFYVSVFECRVKFNGQEEIVSAVVTENIKWNDSAKEWLVDPVVEYGNILEADVGLVSEKEYSQVFDVSSEYENVINMVLKDFDLIGHCVDYLDVAVKEDMLGKAKVIFGDELNVEVGYDNFGLCFQIKDEQGKVMHTLYDGENKFSFYKYSL